MISRFFKWYGTRTKISTGLYLSQGMAQAIVGRAFTCYMNILAVLADRGGGDLKDI
jgi:hypothetical protein